MPLSKKRVAPSDSDSEPHTSTAPTTKSKKPRKDGSGAIPGGGSNNDEGEVYWDISGNRRVTINEFRGKTMVSVREYYEKDGKTLPGKKGITMPLAQFGALIEILPHIEAVLQGKGATLPRPSYDGAADEMNDGAGGNEAGAGASKGKRNIDETSDEDD